jgi:fucose permease
VTPAGRPPRRLLALAYAAFVSLGLPDTVLGVAWPSLRAAFHLPQAAIGLVLAAAVSAYLASGLAAGRVTAALGEGRLLAGSSALVALGLAGHALAPAWPAFAAAAVPVGLGSGAIDAALNGLAARRLGARHLNWLHACYSLGATAGPALMARVLAGGRSYRTGYGLLAAALAAMAACFLAARRALDDRPARAAAGRPPDAAVHASARAVLARPRAWLQIAVFFVYTGLESGAGQWCFTVLRESRGADLGAAGRWTAAYYGSIAAGRVVLGAVVERVGADRLLRGATLGALAGALAFALAPGAAGRLGLVLLGLSLAPIFPTLMARTPARLGPEATLHAVGFQVAAGTAGAAAIPSALGALADRAGVGAIAPGVAVVALALLTLHELLAAGGARR